MSTQTGTAKAALAEALEADFTAFAADLEALRERAGTLQAESAGINGTATFWRGVAVQLAQATEAVTGKRAEVLAALAGKPRHEITATVDADQLERVRQAKEVA